MTQEKIGRSILILTAALLAARLARAMPAGHGALPLAGQHRRAAEALQSSVG